MSDVQKHNNSLKRPFGMPVTAWRSYIAACNDAGLKAPRVVQTVGNAQASAGYHHSDGQMNGENYCAAVDLSVRGFLGVGGYNEKQIKWLLYHMARHGFAGWYRYRKPFSTNRHIHAVFVGVAMKKQLRAQVRDFLNDRDGLAGHRTEVFWAAPADVNERLEALYLSANPGG